MTEIADPLVTPLLIASSITGIAGGVYSMSKNSDVRPSAPVSQVKQVQGGLGEDEASQAEQERRRKKLVANILAKDWDQPVLGQPALLGLGG